MPVKRKLKAAPNIYDATQDARASLADTIGILFSLAENKLEAACPRVEACAELMRLLNIPAAHPHVYPHLPRVLAVVRSIARKGDGMARVRAARLLIRIADLARVSSRPRAVELKPITYRDVANA